MSILNKILVIGSSNIDLITKVSRLPKPGETIGSADFYQVYGGKGANQAVAAARLGGDVIFVTSLGNDIYSQTLKEHFAKENIDTRYIMTDQEVPTGTAVIMVGDDAENFIAVAPGANAKLLPDTIRLFEEAFEGVSILLMQAEIPHETILELAKYAKAKGIKVMFNPAPAYKVGAELLQYVDILVVNETEAEMISGQSFEKSGVAALADKLVCMGVPNVIITLGEAGVYALCEGKEMTVPAFKVNAIDTTAAGDTFCGALALRCLDQRIDRDALRFACASSAITVTRIGAQPSLPYMSEVAELLKNSQER